MPRGRGSAFRGRGSRGSRGRGRGRGRGSQLSRWGPNRKFDSARLAEKGEEDAESEASDTPDEALEDVLSDDDDDDDEDQWSARPYMDLMQQLSTESSARSAKRRKTAHQPAPRETAASKDEEEEAEESGREDVDQPDEAEDPAEENPAEDSEDEADSTDPFDAHFAHPDEQVTAAAVAAAKEGGWTTKRAMLQPWRATVQFAGAEGTMPQPVTGLDGLKLKRKLLETARHKMRGFDAEQRSLAGALFDYRDVLFCNRTVDNADRLRQTVCLHALNHVFKTRDRVIKNNLKLAKAQDADLEFRDQGFTRPKVLFLLPTRNSCAKVMQVFEDLVEPDQQENIKRFNESYRDAAGETFGADRPADFKELFGANDDDMFRIGIKFTRKTIKYFSPFYTSDVLLASPLGLRMAMGSEEEKGRKGTDHDFLSSIEMVIVDQADALLMQNWEHVEYVLEHLNRQPREARDCDFSRVRSWYLDDWARYLRQTVVLSAFLTPELAELQRLHCHNTAGKLRLLPPEQAGVIGQLGVKARQTFSRFACAALDREPDARFDYFTSAVIPWLTKRLSSSSSSSSGGTVIFIPSYLDFVRVRNWFSTADAVSSITFGVVSEYTDVREASRARSHFVSGRHRVLLYTERAHHFRRYHFSGATGVVFYGLPDNPLFYREIAGGFLARSERELTLEPGRGTVRGVFSRYDAMKLERIVGTARVGKMLQDRGDTFDFV